MSCSTPISWIAVDWGTTHLRAYGMSADHEILSEAQSTKGMATLVAGEFEPALLELIISWLPQNGRLPVLACGMVGAKQGWKEAAYQVVPCSPLSAECVLSVTTIDPRIQVYILPGISQAEPADVMRGEETQLAGLLALTKAANAQVCLPGTHSKWVRLGAGEIERFATYMTGEIFALLCQQSILRHSVASSEWDESAFIAGVKSSMANPARVLNFAFSLRAQNLLNALNLGSARSRLSGLLVGAELAGARDYWQNDTVALIGDAKLTRLYSQGLAVAGAGSKIYDLKSVTIAGFSGIYQKLLASEAFT